MKNLEDIYELTPTQQGILWESLAADDSSVYAEQLGFQLRGPLDEEAFHEAWQQVIARHGILRTSFQWDVADHPLQIVFRELELPWKVEDWRQRDETRRSQDLEELLAKDLAQGFPFDRAPLMRCTLLRFETERYHFIWSFHHILLDGWSLPLVLREVKALYSAATRKRPAHLPTPRPFRDFVQWNQHQDTEKAQAFWSAQLAAFDTPSLLVPEDGSTSSANAPVQWNTELDASVTASLKDLSRRLRVTQNVICQAVWAYLMARYTGQDDIVFGATMSVRPAEIRGIESMVGILINTVPVRIRLDNDLPAATWLRRLQEDHQRRQSFSHSSLADIRNWAEIDGGSTWFDTLFVFESYPMDAAPTGPDELTFDFDRVTERTNYPLEVLFLPGPVLGLRFIYDPASFDPRQIEGMAGQIRRILESLAADPEIPVGQLELLTDAESRQLLTEWPRSAELVGEPECLQAAFIRRAKVEPSRPALYWQEQCLTYGDLDRRSALLAAALRSLGVGPETLVGLFVERGPEMIVGILGILRAGAAYVPMDPEYPHERLDWMLEDCHPALVLTEERLRGTLPPTSAQVLTLDGEPLRPGVAVERPSTPENLAYVLYTSGSTGRPKGVAITHHSAWAMLQWAQRAFRAEDLQGVLAGTSICFDLSIFEIFAPLSLGGAIVLAENALQLPELPARDRVTLVNSVPSSVRHLVENREIPETTGIVNLAGEPLPRSLVEAIHQQAPDRQVYNLYGPSEDTTYSTWQRVDSTARDQPAIGRPVDGTEVYIVDRHLRPVPRGCSGELLLGGAGLARGYLHRPALTAARFVPNPFGEGRLYRTGDRVRYRSSGDPPVLEFLGRFDHQVKVRGFRIELGEIETHLRDQELVSEGLVVVSTTPRGSQRLVAHVVPKHSSVSGQTMDDTALIDVLRQALRSRLPHFMVPDAFVIHRALPLLPNGKIDRARLPTPESDHHETFRPPRTEAEETLAAIWAECLGTDRVGINDDFFALGGDSIVAIQVVSRARRAGLRLTPRALLRHPTVATALQHVAPTGDQSETDATIGGSLPLTPIQRWFFDHRREDLHHFNQAVILRLAAGTRADALGRTLAHLMNHHDMLRARYDLSTHPPHQQITDPVEADAVVLNRLDVADLDDGALRQRVATEAHRSHTSLDLSKGPLLRMTFFDRGSDREGLLLWVIHHLGVDGVSWRILTEDLNTVYDAVVHGRSPDLPPKTTSFKTWAHALLRLAQDDEAPRKAHPWLEEAPEEWASLPVDRSVSPGDNRVAFEERVEVTFTPRETEDLLYRSSKAYRTRSEDLLLTALSMALHRFTGEVTHWIDIEGHGREELEDSLDLSRTVGWFTSLYPLRLHLEGDSPGEHLKGIRQQLREIQTRGIWFGMLRYLRDFPELRELPDRTLCFNYLGRFDSPKDLPTSSEVVLGPADMEIGPIHSPRQHRGHLLTADGWVVDGTLRFHWAFSNKAYDRTTVKRLAEGFASALRRLIRHCRILSAAGEISGEGTRQMPLPAAVDPQFCEAAYPLSPLQKGLYFESLYAPDSGVNVEQFCLSLRGPLDERALREAWRRLATRHGILRTSFHRDGAGEPIQAVDRRPLTSWQEIDWRSEPETRQASLLASFLDEDRRRGFSLDRAPASRQTLIRWTEDRHELIWSFHHILIDGWCLPILFRELVGFYESLTGDTPFEPPRPRPYGDFIRFWQRQDAGAVEAFWRHHLKGLRQPTPLPLKQQRPSAESGQETRVFHLPRATSAALEAWVRQHRLTLNTLFQGTWALLLHRLTRSRDILFGVSVSGRPPELDGVEQMVGLFANTVPARVRIAEEISVVDWLHGLQEDHQDRDAHAYGSLADIQSWSPLPGGQKMFETLIAYDNYPVDASLESRDHIGELEVLGIEAVEQTSYPLTVIFQPGREILVRIMTDRSTLRPEVSEQLFREMQELFRTVLEGPSTTVGELFASSREKSSSSQETIPSPAPELKGLVHDHVVGHGLRHPESTAVVTEARSMTYGELERWSGVVARHLRTLGVGPEARVALWLDRSPEMIVAMLGTLRAGGAYVPLDTRWPRRRLSSLLDDCRPRVILTTEALAQRLPERDALGDAAVLVLPEVDDASPEDLDRPEDLDIWVDGSSPAYAIYTSGSTGKPKGVVVSHDSVLSLAAWHLRAFALTASDRTTQLANPTFDASVWEIWPTLIAGATLVIVEPETITAPPTELQNCLLSLGVQVAFLPTPLAEPLITLPWPEEISLRTLLVGGDRLTVRPPSHLPFELSNNYGPTETCVVATSGTVRPADAGGIEPGPPSIGGAIDRCELHVVDSELRPVSLGSVGELLIGGPSLARGYLGRAAFTAERFIPNPWGEGRLYRTGDQVRAVHDEAGNLHFEFVGRLDDQVKIRGQRIELGEIEATLDAHPGVLRSLVLARREDNGEQRLVAYLQPADLDAVGNRFVEEWQHLFEETYGGPEISDANESSGFDLSGWHDSYTGQPLPDVEMNSWVEETIADLIRLKPRRVLEIGCGTGLLLNRLAPQCEVYHATDYSSEVVERLRSHLASQPGLDHVEVHQRLADDFDDLTPETYDLVILNSIVQYFPDAAYLLRVLEGAVQRLAAGGHLYVGDVRSLPHFEAFHASVQLAHSPESMSRADFANAVRRRMFDENELLVDPALFTALPRRCPRILEVSIQLKRGNHHNELTRFRYQAIMEVGEPPAPRTASEEFPTALDWRSGAWTLRRVEQVLQEERPEQLFLENVPNARLQTESRLLAWLTHPQEGMVGDLSRDSEPSDTVDPQAFWALEERLPYRVQISWSTRGLGSMDVLLSQAKGSRRPTLPFHINEGDCEASSQGLDVSYWLRFVNDVQLATSERVLVPRVRQYLDEVLPRAMHPKDYGVVRAWPLTPNGKVDRKALPDPSTHDPRVSDHFVPPSTPTEQTLASIWSEVLGVEAVGRHSDFYHLGGHSLSATRIAARIDDVFGLHLPVRSVLEHPKLVDLSQSIDTLLWMREGDTVLDNSQGNESVIEI